MNVRPRITRNVRQGREGIRPGVTASTANQGYGLIGRGGGVTANIESLKNLYRERALRGKAFLEEHYPGYQIDKDSLSILDERNCALAQASQMEYGKACEELRLGFLEEYELGFFPEIPSEYYELTPRPDFSELLTEVWKEVLAE